MADPPKSIPPEVIEALKRGDKAAALKLLLPGGAVSNMKDLMQLMKTLQETAAAKGANVNVAMHESHGHGNAATPHHPAPRGVPPVPRPGLAPGEVPRTGGAAFAFVALLIAAAIAAWLFLK